MWESEGPIEAMTVGNHVAVGPTRAKGHRRATSEEGKRLWLGRKAGRVPVSEVIFRKEP